MMMEMKINESSGAGFNGGTSVVVSERGCWCEKEEREPDRVIAETMTSPFLRKDPMKYQIHTFGYVAVMTVTYC
jgi:hypothetical protein